MNFKNLTLAIGLTAGMAATQAIGVAVVAFAASIGSARATVVNFDDLVFVPGGSRLVPSPYGGINWGDNWRFFGEFQPPYNAASLPNRIYTDRIFTNTSPAPFYFLADSVFSGAFVSGGPVFENGEPSEIVFSLYNDGTLVHTTGAHPATSTPTFVSSEYSGPCRPGSCERPWRVLRPG